MSATMAGGFWTVSMLFVIIPGVDWAYALAAGLRRGGAVPAVAGMLTGHFLATAIVAAGVGAIVARSPAIGTVLTVAGAGYLVWIGVATVRHPPTASIDAVEATTPSTLRTYIKGVGVSLLNPKVFLLFLALLPQFTDPHGSIPVAGQMIILGAIHVLNCAVIYFAISFGAATLLSRRPALARATSIASGVIVTGFGILIAGETLVSMLV